MTSKDPAPHNPGQTRSRLIEAARDLMIDEGIARVSMRRIASSCGISAAAIYRHFADKDALVSAAAVQGFQTFATYLLASLDSTDAQSRFRRISERYLDFAADHPRDYQLMFMTPCEELGWHKLDESAKREVNGTFQLLVDRVAECQRAGLFREGSPESLAVFAWSSLHGLVSLRLTGNLGPSDDGHQAQMRALQLEAIEKALRSPG